MSCKHGLGGYNKPVVGSVVRLNCTAGRLGGPGSFIPQKMLKNEPVSGLLIFGLGGFVRSRVGALGLGGCTALNPTRNCTAGNCTAGRLVSVPSRLNPGEPSGRMALGTMGRARALPDAPRTTPITTNDNKDTARIELIFFSFTISRQSICHQGNL